MYLIVDHNLWKKAIFIITPSNPSLAHQEVVSDVMYEPPTKRIPSITVSIINTANNGELVEKIKIPQEELSVDYYTTHVEEVFSETSKSYST